MHGRDICSDVYMSLDLAKQHRCIAEPRSVVWNNSRRAAMQRCSANFSAYMQRRASYNPNCGVEVDLRPSLHESQSPDQRASLGL